jgi:plasmid stabilization system protein ParE
LAAVYFSARALADLDRLFDFIADHDPDSAGRAAQRIVDATRILSDHPLIGRPVRGFPAAGPDMWRSTGSATASRRSKS